MKITRSINFAAVALMFLAFAFAVAFYPSPPTRAENIQNSAVGKSAAVKNISTVRAKFVENTAFSDFRSNAALTNLGDIPISVAANYRKNIREILNENYREFYGKKDLVPITRLTKFSNLANSIGNGFSGINADTFARAGV